MSFQEKPKSAAAKASTESGGYRTLLIEKHEKAADTQKQIGIYKKAVDAEVVERTEEGVIIKYPVANAEAYQAKCIAEAQRRVKRVEGIRPDAQHSDIAEVSSNTVEHVSPKELIGG